MTMTSRTVFLLALLGAVLALFGVHLLDFPGSVRNFNKVSGGGILLDAQPSFSEDAIYQRLGDYGAEGRKNYAFRNVTIDVLLPFSVLPLLFLLMQRALKPLSLGRVPRLLLLSIPVAYVIFDLAENGSVLALLATFPDRAHVVANVLPYVTVVKRTASLLAFLIPLAIFSVLRVRRGRLKVG
jgi:uncharacterized membrane protein